MIISQLHTVDITVGNINALFLPLTKDRSIT